MLVQNPFFSSVPNIPQRGRFSPFQFKGMAFSTGGFSALYGQALSSVMLMNTTDLPLKSSLTAGLNLIGANAGYTQKWKKTSLSGNASLFDMGPLYLKITRQ